MDRSAIGRVSQLIDRSKRPLLVIGNGARGSNYLQLGIPIVTTRMAIDLISSDHPLFVGRPGLVSERVSHFAIQNADLIIVIGARLDPGFIGYQPKDWGRNAKKIIVDIDPQELYKPGVKADIRILGDAKEFINLLATFLPLLGIGHLLRQTPWSIQLKEWKKKYSLQQTGSYGYVKKISDLAKKDDVIVVDTSSSFHIVAQVWGVKKGQTYITTGGISTMGYWPAAIGAALASKRRVLCFTGDGCMQMNIQELATVVKHKLNIKIFLLNNNGYLLIRHTQRTHLDKRLIGEGPKSGLSFPNFKTIAKAYGIPYTKNIKKALSMKGPVLCEIFTPYWEKLEPRMGASKNKDGSFTGRAFEDLSPYLSRRELNKNLWKPSH